MPKLIIAAYVSLITLLVNVPMGYWRAMVRKFSFQWFVAIHLAVPLIYILRVKTGLGYGFIPELAFFAVVGQLIGGKIEGLYS